MSSAGCRLPGGSISCALQCTNGAVDDHEVSVDSVFPQRYVQDNSGSCWLGQPPDAEDLVFGRHRHTTENDSVDVSVETFTDTNSLACRILASSGDGQSLGADSYEEAIKGARLLDALQLASATPEESAARLQTIAQLFEASEAHLAATRVQKDGWCMEKVGNDGLEEFGYRHTSDGRFETVSHIVFPTADPLLGIAALMEVDLCQGYRTNVSTATCLHEADTCSSVWRFIQVGAFSGKPEDNIAEVFAIDALAEASNCFWVHFRAVDACETCAEVCRCNLPTPEDGRTRHGSAFVEFRVQRLKSGGFRLTNFSSTKVSGAMKASVMVPGWMLKPMMRRKGSETAATFRKHLEHCHELSRRISSDQASRAALYQRVRPRLTSGASVRKGGAETLSSQVGSTCDGGTLDPSMAPMEEDESCDGENVISVEEMFLSFSAEIPTVWAD